MACKTLYYKTKPKANQTINLENYSSSTSSKEKKKVRRHFSQARSLAFKQFLSYKKPKALMSSITVPAGI
ncbi:hypothetical protein Hanom_Chr14g01269381 [Helianthus anomalus]